MISDHYATLIIANAFARRDECEGPVDECRIGAITVCECWANAECAIAALRESGLIG